MAAESPHGWDLALEWIDSPDVKAAVVGWGTLSSLVALRDDADLDLPALGGLLERVKTTIHAQPDRVRYKMNGFVISLGSYVAELTDEALRAGEEIGKVQVDMGRYVMQSALRSGIHPQSRRSGPGGEEAHVR